MIDCKNARSGKLKTKVHKYRKIVFITIVRSVVKRTCLSILHFMSVIRDLQRGKSIEFRQFVRS